MADRIVLMRGGAIEQVGTPDDLYNRPASTYVASFIGAPTMNLLGGELVDGGSGSAVRLETGTVLPLPRRLHADAPSALTLGIRPENFAWQEMGGPALDVMADVVEPLGSDTLVFCTLGAAELVARLPPSVPIHPGDRVRLWPDLDRLHLFDAASGRAVRAA